MPCNRRPCRGPTCNFFPNNSWRRVFRDFTTSDNSYHFQQTVFFVIKQKTMIWPTFLVLREFRWNSRDEEMSRAAYWLHFTPRFIAPMIDSGMSGPVNLYYAMASADLMNWRSAYSTVTTARKRPLRVFFGNHKLPVLSAQDSVEALLSDLEHHSPIRRQWGRLSALFRRRKNLERLRKVAVSHPSLGRNFRRGFFKLLSTEQTGTVFGQKWMPVCMCTSQ